MALTHLTITLLYTGGAILFNLWCYIRWGYSFRTVFWGIRMSAISSEERLSGVQNFMSSIPWISSQFECWLRFQRIAEYSSIHSRIYCLTRKTEAKYSEVEHPAPLTHDPRHARFVLCSAHARISMATWGLSHASSKQERIRKSCRRPSQGEREAGMQAIKAWCFCKERRVCLPERSSCTTTS